MVLLTGFLKMMGTASVALTGSTSSPASSRGLAALTGGGPHAAGAPGEAMRIKSPLIYSFPISSLENVRLDQSTRLFLFPSMPPPTHPPPFHPHIPQAPPTYLKLDALQPSGSFKDRGMATLCESLKEQGAKRLISSSGGNAGHSAALCGRVLGLPVRVIVPTTTKVLFIDLIE